jgi:chromosome segregation ATPase
MAFKNGRITGIPAPLPVDYDKGFSFEDWQDTNPGQPLPGRELDIEFTKVEEALDETQDRLALVQREDGALQNEIVTPDSLATATEERIEDLVRPFATTATAEADRATAQAVISQQQADRALDEANRAELEASTAQSASDFLSQYLDEFGQILELPADLGLISDDVVSLTYDLGDLN